MAIQGLSAQRIKLFRIPRSGEGTVTNTSVKSILLHLFTVWVKYPFPSLTKTNSLKTNDKHKPLSFLSFKCAELLTSIAPCHVVNLHFRPRACGGSRVLLAHTGCWGGGFCLLCRQASMARWAQYDSRGSSAANLQQKKSKKQRKRGALSELSGMIRGQSSMAVSGKPAGAGSGLDGLGFSPRI